MDYYEDEEDLSYEDYKINEAVNECLQMINENNHLSLNELEHFTIEQCRKHNVKTLCHCCVCLDFPGIVTYIVYGGVTQEYNKKYIYYIMRG